MQNGFDFQTDVIEASKSTPVVVDFWAEWCAPCRALGPVLEKLADQAEGTWTLVKVDTEEHREVAMEYRIQGIPAVKMFSDGKVIAEFVGALPETQVKNWLAENIPTESKKLIAEANSALEAGQEERAKLLFEQVLQNDETNYDARVPLAALVFETDPANARELAEATPEGHPLHLQADAIKTLTRLIGDSKSVVGRAQESEAWRLYAQGVQALSENNYAGAFENWIAALNTDRDIDDDGPRRACVALFTWLGQDHELTMKYHRAFTSALF